MRPTLPRVLRSRRRTVVLSVALAICALAGTIPGSLLPTSTAETAPPITVPGIPIPGIIPSTLDSGPILRTCLS